MSSIQKIAHTAVFTALLCVAAPFTVQIGPIPLSLATLVIYIAAGTLGRTLGTLSVAVYILLGAIGLPVFSNFGAGLAKLLGLTGGFIFGYIPLAYVTGSLAFLSSTRRRLAQAAGMILGTIVLYALGSVWYIVLTGAEPLTAVTACVLPFLPGDAVKIAAASTLTPVLNAALKRSIIQPKT